MKGKLEFTYGEIIFYYFLPILQLLNPKENEVFLDLGSGSGKVVTLTSLTFPKLKKVIGIELLDSLYSESLKV